MEMGLSVPISESYLNDSFFTTIFSKNHYIILFENWQGINRMGISDSLSAYKTNNTSQTWKCFQQPFYKKMLQGINPMEFCVPWSDTYSQNWILEELFIIDLNLINILMTTGEITKSGTLATTFQKPAGGGGGPYTWFRYVQLKIANARKDKIQDQWTLIR